MPALMPYKRSYSFANHQADVPDQPLPGNRVDIELDNLAQSTTALVNRMNLGVALYENEADLELLVAEIDRVVFVADNMTDVRNAVASASAAAGSATAAAGSAATANTRANAASASAGAAAGSATAAAGSAATANTRADAASASAGTAAGHAGTALTHSQSALTQANAAGASATAAGTARDQAIVARDAIIGAQSITAGMTNVRAFGAVAYDGVSDQAAFQAAIDSLPDVAGPHVIEVPQGNYHGALGSLSYGNRNIVWRHSGGVNYVTAAPPGWRAFTDWLGDRRPWMNGGYGFARDEDTGTPRPVVDVRRITDHTGGSIGQVHSGISVQTNVATSVGNYENALTAVIEDRVTQLTPTNFCAFQGEARRKATAAGSKALVFGANILAKDETVLASAASGGGVIGLEINVAARGVDDANNRIMLDLIPKCFGQTGMMEAYAGIRMIGSTTGGTTTLKRGISIEPGGGTVNRGVHIEAVNEAIYVAGAPSAAFDSNVTNAALVRLGSTRNTVGSVVGVLSFTGNNAAAARTAYGSIEGSIVAATTGAENGALAMRVAIGGTNTAVISASGAVPLNPLSLRVGGALKQVTEGAADSGGSGFRALRVPN